MTSIHTSSPDASLARKVISGGAWILSARVLNRGLGLLRTLILARLLSPMDFGILGIALVTISGMEALSQMGFNAALIQRKENAEQFLDTAWTVAILRGVVLFTILFFSSPWIADFFESPQAKAVIQVVSVTVLLSGFQNVGIIFFTKQLDFKKLIIFELSGTLAEILVAVPLAIMLRNVWALVWGFVAANCCRLVLSFILHAYRPTIHFDSRQFRVLFGYGRWVLGSGILVFLVTQGDDIFVGKVLGVTALGFYQIAYLIANMPTTEITKVLFSITFPAYSKLQDDAVRLREGFLKVLKVNVFIAAPVAGGIFALASELVEVCLGEKWMPIVLPLKILIIAGFARAVSASTGSLFYGIGKPRIDTGWQVTRLIVLAISIYPLAMGFGLLGVSISVFLSVLISGIGFNFSAIKNTGCGFRRYGKAIFVPILTTFIMVCIIGFLRDRIQFSSITELLFLIGVGAISYGVFASVFDKLFHYGIGKIVREQIMQ